MPDWITHISVAFLITLGIKENRSLVILGSVLPDAVKFSFFLSFLSSFNPFVVFHTALGTLLFAALLSTFFDTAWKRGFSLILLGSASHLLLDSLHGPYGDYYWFLWPIWTGYTNFGFIWHDSYLPALFSSSAALAALVYKRFYMILTKHNK